ncbi:T9SS type A sorting domain-containing protein [Polaribacter aestuariivivens]|uniref:T9SS type A sorting domain-containing protein n=1 Tax=Polaribacter aestuariivivens TaxID=2304626 RepID=UPI003F4941DE
MNLRIILLFLIFTANSVFAQNEISNFKEKFDLPNQVKETSGLLFFNGKIITHNDSGDSANLYEIDSLNGSLLRTVSISNASNIDWEDITEDESHLYIGDIGNNNGNRNDLTIYKVLKSDFKNNTSVTAEIISFTYEDQTDFTNKPNSSNFDAETIVVFGESILIFTKNWANFETNVYEIPKLEGNYSAKKVSTANVEGLITGGSYNYDRFYLTGYDATFTPFLIYIGFNRKPGSDIFFSGFSKISLENEIGKGSQIEGITNTENTGKYYISREFFTTNQNGMQFTFPQKLYEFFDFTSYLLSTNKNSFNNLMLQPNPVNDKLTFTVSVEITKIEIYNSLGKLVSETNKNLNNKVDVSGLSSGNYFLKLHSKNNKTTIKKFIKL